MRFPAQSEILATPWTKEATVLTLFLRSTQNIYQKKAAQNEETEKTQHTTNIDQKRVISDNTYHMKTTMLKNNGLSYIIQQAKETL